MLDAIICHASKDTSAIIRVEAPSCVYTVKGASHEINCCMMKAMRVFQIFNLLYKVRPIDVEAKRVSVLEQLAGGSGVELSAIDLVEGFLGGFDRHESSEG